MGEHVCSVCTHCNNCQSLCQAGYQAIRGYNTCQQGKTKSDGTIDTVKIGDSIIEKFPRTTFNMIIDTVLNAGTAGTVRQTKGTDRPISKEERDFLYAKKWNDIADYLNSGFEDIKEPIDNDVKGGPQGTLVTAEIINKLINAYNKGNISNEACSNQCNTRCNNCDSQCL